MGNTDRENRESRGYFGVDTSKKTLMLAGKKKKESGGDQQAKHGWHKKGFEQINGNWVGWGNESLSKFHFRLFWGTGPFRGS